MLLNPVFQMFDKDMPILTGWRRDFRCLGDKAMKSASETIDLLDYLIDAFVRRGSSAGTPEATEEVLRQLDFVREAILNDLSLQEWQGLPIYSSYLFNSGYGSGSFCGRQRNKDSSLSNDTLLAGLREFWEGYFSYEHRPKRA